MSNITLLRTRAWLGFVLILFLFPVGLLVAVLKYIYNNFVLGKVCKSIAGDVAVITGSAGGLGKCIAEALAAKGCHVAIVDIKRDLAVATAEEIAAKYGVKAKAYKVDVTKYEEIVELNKSLTKDIGAATILVNNAGILLHADQMNPSMRDIQMMIDVNYTSHFWTNDVFLKNMKQAGRGHIVAISSLAGLFVLPYSEPYCSTKTAVRTLMRVLRAELKHKQVDYIGTTTVFPFFLQTHSQVSQMVSGVGFDRLYPQITGEEVAKRVVRGMLHNEVEITLPGFTILLYRLWALFPARTQDWLNSIPLTIFKDMANVLAAIQKK